VNVSGNATRIWRGKVLLHKLFTKFLPEKVLIKMNKPILEASTEGILNILTCCERERNHEIVLKPRLYIKVTRYIRRCGLCVGIVGGRVGTDKDECYSNCLG
jgi:hypothetical protein